MKCQGNFVFKTLTFRKGGIFRTDEGKEINYPSAYILKVDELKENGEIEERKFKITENKTLLINSLKTIESYQKIILNFNIDIHSNKILLDVDDVIIDNNIDILD